MPRKTWMIRRRIGEAVVGASMRPRPDAAENAAWPHDTTGGQSVASMRPRPDAAENSIGASLIRELRTALQ